jgi:hypothetical protein
MYMCLLSGEVSIEAARGEVLRFAPVKMMSIPSLSPFDSVSCKFILSLELRDTLEIM